MSLRSFSAAFLSRSRAGLRLSGVVAAFAIALIAISFALHDDSDAAEDERRLVTLTPGPDWKVLSTFSGGIDYYQVVEESGEKLIHASYHPKLDTVIKYRKLRRPRAYRTMQWKWRVQKFPQNADERVEGRRDSAAAVYVYFRETVREYAIKYAWSVALEKGANFETDNSNFLQKMRFVVLEGPPPVTGAWRTEKVDLHADFRKYFPDGDTDAKVPPVVGVGILTDGDGTKSIVEADYAGFELGD